MSETKTSFKAYLGRDRVLYDEPTITVPSDEVDVVPRPEGAPEGFPVGSCVRHTEYGLATVLTPVYKGFEGWYQQVQYSDRSCSSGANVSSLHAYIPTRRFVVEVEAVNENEARRKLRQNDVVMKEVEEVENLRPIR